jgi:hypothetical protein
MNAASVILVDAFERVRDEVEDVLDGANDELLQWRAAARQIRSPG